MSNKRKYSHIGGKILDICKLWGENRMSTPHTLQPHIKCRLSIVIERIANGYIKYSYNNELTMTYKDW